MNISEVIRFTDWMYFLLLPSAGWLFDRNPEFPNLVIGLISSALLLAHAYSFNNYKDNRVQQSVWWHRWPLIISWPTNFSRINTYPNIVNPDTGLLNGDSFKVEG
ncbi:MAG: hypothetical protein COV73_03965 [Candidatus Omnitrophica bacterium CG11_big_fil_rev_8_21_14_0_20_43_6]|nr:MAG: hypothetical protein COV73_03965 [Candidatus Omnitrophica bacterium CG11_big_fil_rev_8_21_14_0_20_43_6]